MTKILDFLVENYIYVAAISGFLIIALIGFLIKGKKKNKEDISLEKETTLPDENVQASLVTEQPVNTDFLNKVVEPVKDEVKPSVVVEQPTINSPIPEQVKPVELNNSNMFHVEPAVETFQVKLDNNIVEPSKEVFLTDIPRTTNNYEEKNGVEMFNIDENIVLNREKLDEEVDIIDFSDLNSFESNEEIPKPQDINNNL